MESHWQEYLTASNSTLKTHLHESYLQPARKVKITPVCWIPSDIFVGISIMEKEDRNKVLSRISQQPGRWKLRDLEMVVKTFWRISFFYVGAGVYKVKYLNCALKKGPVQGEFDDHRRSQT